MKQCVTISKYVTLHEKAVSVASAILHDTHINTPVKGFFNVLLKLNQSNKHTICQRPIKLYLISTFKKFSLLLKPLFIKSNKNTHTQNSSPMHDHIIIAHSFQIFESN